MTRPERQVRGTPNGVGHGDRGAARSDADGGRTARTGLDLTGLTLFAAAAGWTFVAARLSGGRPEPVAALFVACGFAWAAGKATATRHRLLVPGAVVVAAAALALYSPESILSRAPLAGPFGYANAKGAFFVQAALAGLMVAVGSRRIPGRAVGVAAAVAFAAVPILTGSNLAAVLVLALPAVALVVTSTKGARIATTAFGTLVVLALVTTILLGVAYRPGSPSGVDRAVDALLSERRPALWADALTIIRDRPVTGVGPRRFQLSPVVESDRDARWAHNGFLQQGAEAGVIGLALLVILFAWGFVRLGSTPGADRLTALSGAALAALGVHACIDYILHFPAVPITAAALVGVGAAVAKDQ